MDGTCCVQVSSYLSNARCTRTCAFNHTYIGWRQQPSLKEQHESIIKGIEDHRAGLSVKDPLTGLLLPPIKVLSDGSVTLAI